MAVNDLDKFNNVVPINSTVKINQINTHGDDDYDEGGSSGSQGPLFYSHDPELEFEQRKEAQKGHDKFASRIKDLKVQDKKNTTENGESMLKEHPAMADSAYGQGVAPSLADVLNNPAVIEQLEDRDPNELSPELRQQLMLKLGYVPGKSKKAAPTFSPPNM
jgi:hypothetical protein